MSEADFKTIHTSAQFQTPPPRGYLSVFTPGNTLGFTLPANSIKDHGDGATEANQPSDHQTQQPFAGIAAEDVEEADRLAQWLKKKEMNHENKCNRTVTISPLPDFVTAADVLPRIRGGVESCYVSQFEETRVAVVTFKLAADAITYSEFCAETPIWSLWTFEMSRPGVIFTWERRAKVLLYTDAPGKGTAWSGPDIPSQGRPVVLAGSRCLIYKGCKPFEVPGIYRALGLHMTQHQRDQVEGMWLDGPVRDHKGNPVHGNLHVWYTSIKAAQEARSRVALLEFEYDPCSDSPDKLLLYVDEGDDLPVFRHHEPFVNLVEMNEKTVLTCITEGMFDPVQAYWRCRAPLQQVPDFMTSVADRLQLSLQINSSQPMMPRMPGTYQAQDVTLPPAALSDPFLDPQVTATGYPPATRNHGATPYSHAGFAHNIPTEYQPFAASQIVEPAYHVSPLQTFIARSQERQALGYPPYHRGNQDELPQQHPIQPPSSLTPRTGNKGSVGVSGTGAVGDSTGTDTINEHSNLGGPNNPQSGRQPRSGVPGDSSLSTVHDTSFISGSSSSLATVSTSSVSLRDTSAVPKTGHGGSAGESTGDSSEEVGADNPGTGSDITTEVHGVALRGGKAVKSGSNLGTITPTVMTPGKYSRKDLDTQDIFWTCSLQEFRAMSDIQWASFGTAFYIAPAGFDTATKHTIQLG